LIQVDAMIVVISIECAPGRVGRSAGALEASRAAGQPGICRNGRRAVRRVGYAARRRRQVCFGGLVVV